MESVRKDVECTFGILKGRFRFLSNKIVIQSAQCIEDAFTTCCILHNMLLKFDGLDRRWENDIDWEELNPQVANSDEGYDEDDIEISQNARIVTRLRSNRHITPPSHGVNVINEDIDDGFHMKRHKLAMHFSYCWKKRLVRWPKALKEKSLDNLDRLLIMISSNKN